MVLTGPAWSGRQRWSAAIAFLVSTIPALASNCTLTSGTGRLSASAWDCGHIPGSGDSATLPSGVTITVDQDWIVGPNGPAGTAALRQLGSSFLIVGPYHLTLRGDWIYSSTHPAAPIATFNSARVTIDSSLAPAGATYRIGPDATAVGPYWAGTGCSFDVVGSGGGFNYSSVGGILSGNDMTFDGE